ncbi:unnamed protein product [Orchesella dallaii]|uniref:CRAL-TRIO domain-containing protein n=1 Tax=Orchesella dallaii TaxID=48710 RepID=A0ABP1R2J3_9HEXA
MESCKTIANTSDCEEQGLNEMRCLIEEDWNTDDYNLEHITIILANAMDKLLFDEDIMNHGLTLIVNSNGLGFKHGMQFTLGSMLRLVHVFWYAYPIRIKGVYFVNVAIYLQYLHKLARPLFPKKLKERFFMTSDKKFEALYEAVSPKVLPKFLGGVHKNEDCFDLSYLPKSSQND